ncbi:putative signal peptide-containing protein [Cryptosporidium canis]|uniref:Signal peptide-containing protein n=1 Tax=Cryptosporidium canis TaxID=195482 RepID=A0ABQ8P683_9CRYT|nr:putative signal peptide-containing protein [Cryptosporidium canis]KAJ1613441.1 putative signal peptide-containing protein [Cryptosporidium canis]
MRLITIATYLAITILLAISGCLSSKVPKEGDQVIVPIEEGQSRTFLLESLDVSKQLPYSNHLPGEVYYSTDDYTLNIGIKLAFYGDYIASDFDYINVKPKYGPRFINTCGHFVHRSVTPKYTVLVSLGGLSSHECSNESIKFFRKFVNYVSSIYGTEMVNETQFIFINWFYLVYYEGSDRTFYTKIVKYWVSNPSKRDVIVPAVSTAAFINKLHRVGVIPSMSNTGAYGLCIGALNLALASLLVKEDMKIVILNAPAFFKRNYLRMVVDSSLNRLLTTKYCLFCGKDDRYFHYKRHCKNLSKFIGNYSSHVRYIKLDADHAELMYSYVYTGIQIIATALLNKEYSITYIRTKDYDKIPKSFSHRHWFRYVMYNSKAE